MLQTISLYLFSIHGIILWDEYPNYPACVAQKEYFEIKFSDLKESGTFSAECLELGKTIQELLSQEDVITNSTKRVDRESAVLYNEKL